MAADRAVRQTDYRLLKPALDRHYRSFDFGSRVMEDPIRFPKRYDDPADIEVAGFLAASFAYGRVDLFSPFLERLFTILGPHPAAFLGDMRIAKVRRLTSGMRYRFNSGNDILALLYIMRTALREHGSLECLFVKNHFPYEHDTGRALEGAMNAMRAVDVSPVYGRKGHPAGLLQFFPRPSSGSACKRLNLFLRWMVRDRDIDLGIWKKITPDRLVIPLDTHIMRIAACIGLTRRRSAGWKAAAEITESLRRLDPADPLKYDFALCHFGMSGRCAEHRKTSCRGCELRPRG